QRPPILTVGDLRLDPATREVARGQTPIELSSKEFALLETFMRRPGEVLSRLHLLEHAWDFAYDNRSNVIDVYVRRLRRKIDEPFARHSLETVRGVGYRLRREGDRGAASRSGFGSRRRSPSRWPSSSPPRGSSSTFGSRLTSRSR